MKYCKLTDQRVLLKVCLDCLALHEAESASLLLETLTCGPSPTALSSDTASCLSFGKHPELMTSSSKGFAWPTICGGPIWLCFGLSLCLLSGLVLSCFPILSSFSPLSEGVKQWQHGEGRWKDYCQTFTQAYFVGLKTEGLELKTIPRFLPPESDQNAIALPTWQALLGD